MNISNDNGLFVDSDNGHLVGYLMDFARHGIFAPGGKVQVTPEAAETNNRLLSEAEIAGLDKCEMGQHGTLYYTKGKGVRTWYGTLVSDTTFINGQSITFTRNGKRFRGRLKKDADCFNFKRIA